MTEDGKKMTENYQKSLYSNFLGVREIDGKIGTRGMQVIVVFISVWGRFGNLGIFEVFFD